MRTHPLTEGLAYALYRDQAKYAREQAEKERQKGHDCREAGCSRDCQETLASDQLVRGESVRTMDGRRVDPDSVVIVGEKK